MPLSSLLLLSFIIGCALGCWAYVDSEVHGVSLKKGREWKKSDSVSHGATFAFLSLLLGPLGLLFAFLQYSSLRGAAMAHAGGQSAGADELAQSKGQMLAVQSNTTASGPSVNNTSEVPKPKKLVW